MTDTTKPAAPPVIVAAACTIRAGYGNDITFHFDDPATALRLRAIRGSGKALRITLVEEEAKPE